MRIALYFGSFNPIHNGHLGLAQYILANSDMEALWFVPSPQNPLKVNQSLLDDDIRLELTRLAVKSYPELSVCDIEFSLPKPNYTWNTLQTLQKRYPEHQFTLLIGADNMEIFDRWRNYDQILSHFRVMVYPREGYVFVNDRFPSMQLIEAPLFNVSSTQIRKAIETNSPFENLIPSAVADYIKTHKLYGYASS